MDILEYKCPNCGADLKFSPTTQMLTCEYCTGSFTVDEVKNLYAGKEQSDESPAEDTSASDEEFEENAKIYCCTSCGAEIMAEPQQTALFCYYCHNPVIISGKMSGQYRPQKIIGFKMDRASALKQFKSWCFKKFVPNDFRTNQQLEKITGMYVPFWLADCNVSSSLKALGTQVKRWTSGGYNYTNTKEFQITRAATLSASGVPADGSQKIDDDLMESIEPFDYGEIQDFTSAYMSGFYADKFDMNKDDIFPRIKERVTAVCREKMRNSMTGYNSLRMESETYDFTNTNWTYIMLPVWFMSYKYKNQIYEFVMNGQTGKIAGSLPISHTKLNAVSAGIFAAVTAVSFVAFAALIGGIF